MFRWKDYVYEVYKEKSFTKAAQNLYISQPSLSARIKSIEDELGAPLFDRSTNPLRLTSVGEVYIEAAEEIGKIEARVENYINDLNTLRSGNLVVGASNVFAAYALPPIITEFKKKYPDVKIKLIEDNTARLAEMLSTNTLDLVIDNNHYDVALYDKEMYSNERILLAVPKSYSKMETERFRITAEDLSSRAYLSDGFRTADLSLFSDVPFVMLTPGNDTRIRGDQLCRASGFRPTIALELNQQATAYMVASSGVGAAFISDTLAARLPAFDNLDYYKLDGAPALRTVYFYYKKHKIKTKVMQEFIRMIAEK